MRTRKKPLTYAHLHAYADQELIDLRRADVSNFVKTHPNLIIHIRDYQFINEQLHKLYDRVLTEPVPKHMVTMVKRKSVRSGLRIMYLVFIGMALGGIIGILAHQFRSIETISNAKDLFETLISLFI